MATTLQDYAALDFYQHKTDPTAQDFVRGDAPEFWIQELPYGESTPPVIQIAVGTTTAPVVDAEVMSVIADTDCTLYKNDILNFSEGIIVIAADVSLTASVEADIAVLPIIQVVTGTAQTYAMVPVLSIADGGLPEFSGTEAQANNKNQGLWIVKAVVSREGTINQTGSYYTKDPSIEILSRVAQGWRNLYFESRFAPYEVINSNGVVFDKGRGPGTAMGVITVLSFSIGSTKTEIATVNGTYSVSGRPKPYELLTPVA